MYTYIFTLEKKKKGTSLRYHYAQIGTPVIACRFMRSCGRAERKRIHFHVGKGCHVNEKCQKALKDPLKADDLALGRKIKGAQQNLYAGAMQPGYRGEKVSKSRRTKRQLAGTFFIMRVQVWHSSIHSNTADPSLELTLFCICLLLLGCT